MVELECRVLSVAGVIAHFLHVDVESRHEASRRRKLATPYLPCYAFPSWHNVARTPKGAEAQALTSPSLPNRPCADEDGTAAICLVSIPKERGIAAPGAA